MATIKYPELAYSFRQIRATTGVVSPENAVLARIEQLLFSAADAYAERRYSDSIKLYKQVRKLLWSQLFPATRFEEATAWQSDLMSMLVSYAGEWLNVLPIEQAAAGVRPREKGSTAAGSILGLNSSGVGQNENNAMADLQTAEWLIQQGNIKSAKFFEDRATELAPEFVNRLTELKKPGNIDIVDRPVLGTTPRDPVAVTDVLGGAISPLPHLSTAISASHIGSALSPQARLSTISDELPSVSIPPALTIEKRSYTAQVGDSIGEVVWIAGDAPATNEIISRFYDSRRGLKNLPDILIQPERESDVAITLAHAWCYETALGLAECYHASGDWATAELWYERTATYKFINIRIEVPYVWSKLAALYRDWGDALFRSEDPAAALKIYEKVLTHDNQPGSSSLYTVDTVKSAANIARNIITNIDAPAAISESPAISTVIFDIQSQLAKISGGLDFWGHWGTNVPLWTFDYLQSVAVNFCQLAIGAERDAMNFWEKAERGELTRLQLSHSVALSQSERDAAQQQVNAARAERDAYALAVQAASLRAANARAAASDYASKSAQWILHQALSAQLSGGEDGDGSELNALADQMMQGGYSISGDRGTLAAAESLTAARLQRQNEINRLNRQADELDAALVQAQAELEATGHRVAAAQAAAHSASIRVQSAEVLLDAFEDQRFTPDVWHQLGEKINHLAQRYLIMALDIAKRMQRSYNFENDVSVGIIKSDYSTEAVNGLLAADTLMADVQSFTYDLITSTTPKPQPVRQTISLANNYPFLFETQFRATGRMEFQTSIDDFDSMYPGSYAGRVEHVEVEIDGIVPTRGINGTLSNSGISHYRLPSTLWTGGTSGLKHRIQLAETLVLSDYRVRNDIVLIDNDRRRRRVFEGAGTASSWTLDIPSATNSFDYAHIVDVRLTFTYEARFDPSLKQQVLTELASRPGALERQRPIPLRWLFPDAFFSFYRSGKLDFTLGRGEFAANEDNPQLIEFSLLITTSPRARASGIVLKLTAPGGDEITVTTNSDGIVPSSDLSAVAGSSALGDYVISIDGADNPSWVVASQLDVDAIQNIAVVVGYSYTPRS